MNAYRLTGPGVVYGMLYASYTSIPAVIRSFVGYSDNAESENKLSLLKEQRFRHQLPSNNYMAGKGF
jgi:hypothetical protein